jgi:DNA-binding transcriptional LysR family regulator
VELRQLRYFTVICEEGSLTRAGARLHIAQQSLSQTVAALESELGVPLLQRGSFGVRATAAGRVLRDRSTALLRDADAAARAVQQAAGLGSGHVRIRYGLDSEHIVDRLLPRIRAGVPDVEITGWTGSDSDNLRALRAGDADLALAWAVDGHVGDLHTATVAHEHCWAAVPTAHPLACRDAVPVEALAGQPLVMFPREAAPWVFDHITGHFTAAGRLSPRIRQTPVSGQSGMVDAASAAGVVTPVSRSLVASLERPGTTMLPFDPELVVPLHLVWRHGLSPGAAAVVDAARAVAP